MLAELGEPIMSSTLILPGDDMPLTDPEEMRARLEHQVTWSWTAALAAWNRPPWWTSPARRRGCCGAEEGPPRPSAVEPGLYNARMPEFSLVQKILLYGIPPFRHHGA